MGSISWPSITTDEFAFQRSGWMVHSIGVPERNVIGSVIKPEINQGLYSLPRLACGRYYVYKKIWRILAEILRWISSKEVLLTSSKLFERETSINLIILLVSLYIYQGMQFNKKMNYNSSNGFLQTTISLDIKLPGT